MKVGINKVVELSYMLKSEGKLVEEVGKENALDYIHGTHMLLPKFEENLEGKEVGDTFEFTLTPEEGYGEIDEQSIIELPLSAFQIDGEVPEDLLEVGKILPMTNAQGGLIRGTIAAIGDESVTMDFNHPMAGKTLHFSGKIEGVREATEKELTEGLHGEYLPQEGGCGCGCGCGGHDGEEGGCGCGGHGHDEEGHCGCGGHDHDDEEGHECGCGCGHHDEY